MGIFQNNLMGAAAAAAAGGDFYTHQIDNSVRMTAPSSTSADNARLTRTVGTVDSNVHWTLNFWIKRSAIEGNNPVSSARPLNMFTPRSGTSGSVLHEFLFGATGSYGAGDAFAITNTNTGTYILSTNNLFRDTSAWYNIHIQADLDNGTASEKLKIFVNGTEASYNVDNRSSYTSFAGMVAGNWTIGDYYNYGYPIQSYLAQWCFIDGTTYAASDFGETKNGVWIPKDPSGLTFGSEGYLLKFESSSDLGNDSSGNNNDWTAVNLATHDQMLDTPTFNSDSNGGNFITYNPLNKGSYTVLSEGNLKADSNTGADATYPSGTFGVNSGKWYVEHLIVTLNGNFPQTTLVDFGGSSYNTNQGIFYAMRYHPSNGCEQGSGTNIADFGTITIVNTGVASFTTGDIISWYIDMDNKKAWIAKNGTIPNSGDPANGTNPQFSWTENPINSVTVGSVQYQTSDTILNAGQDGTFAGNKTAQGNSDDTGYGNFYYAPPTGFLALCSGNQPVADAVDPAQTDDNYPQKLFEALTYTGTGSSGSITTVLQPDFIWMKNRGTTKRHYVVDSNRGINSTSPYLHPDQTVSEGTGNSTGVSGVSSTSISFGGGLDYVNASSNTYVAWNWRANGGTTSSNSNGSITSTVQVDPSGCFSIVTYTGQSASRTVGHGLSTAPDFIIVKSRDNTRNWAVYYGDTGKAGQLNNYNAADTGSYWNNTAPTSSVFSVADVSETGKSENYVAYCFANCEGYIKSGTYVGNGNNDGTFVYTGLRPAWIMCKRVDSSSFGNWRIMDNARDPNNVGDKSLLPNSSAAEESGSSNYVDLLSNGFKLRNTQNWNSSGGTYIYLAMAKNPFKYATSR